MNHTQRRWHALAWLAVAITTAFVLASAWLSRASLPANAELPATLSGAAASKGG